jgi:hypothetical protein
MSDKLQIMTYSPPFVGLAKCSATCAEFELDSLYLSSSSWTVAACYPTMSKWTHMFEQVTDHHVQQKRAHVKTKKKSKSKKAKWWHCSLNHFYN